MSTLKLKGSTSGYVELTAPATAGDNTITLPTGSGTVVVGDGSGNITITGVTTVSAGSTSAPSITPSGDPNTGVFFPSADTIAFAEGGAEAARFDSSGRLLVGTKSTSSSALLQVQGNSSSSTGDAIVQLRVGKNNADILNGNSLGSIQFSNTESTVSAVIEAVADANWNTTNDYPSRLVFSTTADSASSPTERMRITNAGVILGGNTSVNPFHPKAHLFRSTETTDGAGAFIIENSNPTNGTSIFVGVGAAGVGYNASNCVLGVYRCSSNSRSINAAGTINASGADYAEYMTKSGDFVINKGDICGVDSNGLLTNIFADSIGFLVKSTDPSYVGADTWGLGLEEDPEALESARQAVDRIAFAGQVPVNVMGATPGQYIVPIESPSGGIIGISKNKSDLTLDEYIQSIGKVISIGEDGRARIIVKVA